MVSEPLKVLLIGGIYGFPDRLGVMEAPETTLEEGLRARGVAVSTHPHNWRPPLGRYDIVHVHHVAQQTLVQAISPAGRRLVFTRHGVAPLRHPRRDVLDLVVRRTDGYVALSRQEILILDGRVPDSRVYWIPNGIREELWPFSARHRPQDGTPWRLLFVGQLSPVKAPEVLIEAVALLAEQVPVVLRIVFQNESLLSSLGDRVRRLGVDNRVEFVGSLNSRDLATEYQRAHFLVLSSRYEALPSVVTEAMMCGLPVVASAVGGVPDQLGSDGILVQPGAPKELSKALERGIARYDDLLARAEGASAKARAHYSVRAMIDQHLELYDRMLSKPPRRQD